MDLLIYFSLISELFLTILTFHHEANNGLWQHKKITLIRTIEGNQVLNNVYSLPTFTN